MTTSSARIETHPEDGGKVWTAAVIRDGECVFQTVSEFGDHPAYVRALSWCIANGIEVEARRSLDTGGGWNGS